MFLSFSSFHFWTEQTMSNNGELKFKSIIRKHHEVRVHIYINVCKVTLLSSCSTQSYRPNDRKGIRMCWPQSILKLVLIFSLPARLVTWLISLVRIMRLGASTYANHGISARTFHLRLIDGPIRSQGQPLCPPATPLAPPLRMCVCRFDTCVLLPLKMSNYARTKSQ